MEFNSKPTTSTPVLTALVAQQIYALIKLHGNADRAYKEKGNSEYEPEHFIQVNNEIDRIVVSLNQYKSGGVLLSSEVNHFDEVTAQLVIDSPAVYYTYTTDEDLALQVTSALLDVSAIINDVLNAQ